jgi:membrane protein required for beta-lactamase induction
MEELTLITPTFLFSAISLLMLAYTNRFLSYSQLVRTLKDKYMENPTAVTAAQIANLRKRLSLTRAMQMLGIISLFLCVVTVFLIYVGLQVVADYVFGLALVLLICSLGISVREIQISIQALDLYLSDMEKKEK